MTNYTYRSRVGEILEASKGRLVRAIDEERQTSVGQRSAVSLPNGAQHLPLDVSQLNREQPDLGLAPKSENQTNPFRKIGQTEERRPIALDVARKKRTVILSISRRARK